MNENPNRTQTSRDELIALITRSTYKDGSIEPLKGLWLHRHSSPMQGIHSISHPGFCVLARGKKEMFLGGERYLYEPSRYLLVTTEVPLIGHILEASEAEPYLSIRLDLDPVFVGSVIAEGGFPSPQKCINVRAIGVGSLDGTLMDAIVRLVRLIQTPNEAPFIAPLIKREIIYRLLLGEQGDRLRYMAAMGGYSPHIVKAIQKLHKDFNQPLHIEKIAHEVGMSVSGFHHHFKVVTAMSPLQFQKRLRLQEARRLMVGERLDAASAAYRVGYDDASHFTREYRRLFGLPPVRDVERLRVSAQANGVLRAE